MYPSIKEYKEAILFAEDNFEQMKNLRPVLDEDGNPVMSSGNFAVVFKMKEEQTGRCYAVKCFLRDQDGRAEAYRMISEELEYVSSTFLTPVKYLDKELFVDTNAGDEKEFPILLMDWVEGETLDKYIRKHRDDQYELSLLAYQFSRLAMWLMPQPFAHGDLKPDNILVKADGTLVLVDYDGMYVPAMKGQRARELGSPDFRHPSRIETDFDEHIDDFSLASILLSLKAIALQPSLLEEYGAQDRLLFSEKDYRNLSESEALNALRPLMQNAELASLYSLFILAISQNNLSQVSFRLFNLSRPERQQYEEENLSTEVTEEDLANAWTDEYGVMYSKNRKRLLHAPAGIVNYFVIEGTKVICNDAFYNTVTEFNEHAWLKYGGDEEHYCRDIPASDLESINISQSVSVIGKNAFSCCKKLKTIIFHDGIDFIGSAAFKECISIESLIIPNTVKSIGESTFSRCKKLRSIILSEKLESIEASTFRGCVKLESIRIPSNVRTIGDFAFQRCSCLSTVLFPEKLISIGERSFNLCYNLSSLKIPYNLKEIGEDAFLGCTGLQSITVDKRNEYYNSRENCNAIIEANCECLVLACKNTRIPDGVFKIGRNAFFMIKDIKSIVLPDTITEIEFAAFSGCIGIVSIIIPDKVKEIQDAAFLGCKNLESITIKGNIEKLGDRIFVDCDSLNNIIIPKGIKDKFLQYNYGSKLAEPVENGIILCSCSAEVTEEDLADAWIDRSGVKYSSDKKRLLWAPRDIIEYSIIEGVLTICNHAFGTCKELESIQIPNTLKIIGSGSFVGCCKLKSVVVPNSVTAIYAAAFWKCASLVEVILSTSLKMLGNTVFADCVNLKKIDIPKGVSHIRGSAFSGCEELEEAVIPDSITEIGDSAFCGCQNLKSLYIPKSVTSIGDSAFAGSSIQTISIPDSVTLIGRSAFRFSSIKSIVLSNNLKCIGAFCFNSTHLREVVIPDGVTEIEPQAFSCCLNLEKVFIPNSISLIGDAVFYNCPKLKSILIPKGMRKKFEVILSDYKNIIVEQ